MNINLPVDYERLPEFRMLVNTLAQHAKNQNLASQVRLAVQKDVEMAATFLWTRLWIELAYLAQSTNRPGVLTKSGAELYEASLEPLFGDGCEPLDLLERSHCLRRDNGDGEYFCERFSKLNAHLSGNFISREHKGAAGSALVRNFSRISEAADKQAMLLPAEIFKNHQGTQLRPDEVQRAMVVIMTVDNCLKKAGRKKGEYSEGLIADAAQAAQGDPDRLRAFYVWLALHREHPRIPKSAEQILGDWKNMLEISNRNL